MIDVSASKQKLGLRSVIRRTVSSLQIIELFFLFFSFSSENLKMVFMREAWKSQKAMEDKKDKDASLLWTFIAHK